MRKLAGSIISAFTGWSAGVAIASSFFAWGRYHYHVPRGRDDWLFLPFFGLTSAVFVFTVWAVAFAPLYFLVPVRSILWRWPVCTVCGAVAGTVLMWGWHRIVEPQARGVFPFLLFAGVVGGVTCFTASFTRARFSHPKKA